MWQSSADQVSIHRNVCFIKVYPGEHGIKLKVTHLSLQICSFLHGSDCSDFCLIVCE